MQPMSDVEYTDRRSKIETDYKSRLEELSVLIEHFKGRGHAAATTGPFDPASSQPLNAENVDAKITSKLESEAL